MNCTPPPPSTIMCCQPFTNLPSDPHDLRISKIGSAYAYSFFSFAALRFSLLTQVSTAWEINDGETCTLTVWTASGETEVSLDEVSYTYYASRMGHFEHRALPSAYVLIESECTSGGENSSTCAVTGCASGNPSGCAVGCDAGYACCNCKNIFKAPSCECVTDSDDDEEEVEVEEL